MTCLLNIFQPFMKIWVKKDELMFEYPAVICFSIYFYIVVINNLLNNYKDAAGIWHEDRFRPLVTAVANLTMNLIMVRFWGVYGVLLSTVLSMLLIGMPWLLDNLFSTIFEKRMMKGYLKKLLQYACASCGICAGSIIVCRVIPFRGIAFILVSALICALMTTAIYILLFRKTEEFQRSIEILDRITKHKMHLSNWRK